MEKNCNNCLHSDRKGRVICVQCNGVNNWEPKKLNDATPEEWDKASEAVRDDRMTPGEREEYNRAKQHSEAFIKRAVEITATTIPGTIYIADVCCDKARMIVFRDKVVVACEDHKATIY